MEINLILISAKRTITILMTGLILILTTIIMTSTLREYQPFLSFVTLLIGGLILYLILKKYSKYYGSIAINQENIRIEDVTVNWNSINSFAFGDNGLLTSFTVETNERTYRITGLSKGPNGEKFNLFKSSFLKILTEREQLPESNKIEIYNFYETKIGKRIGLITLSIITVATLTSAYVLIVSKKIKTGSIFDLGILMLVAFAVIRLTFYNKK